MVPDLLKLFFLYIMDNREKLEFIKEVLAPLNVDELIRMYWLRTVWNDDFWPTTDDMIKLHNECQKSAFKNRYSEKDLRIALDYAREIAWASEHKLCFNYLFADSD